MENLQETGKGCYRGDPFTNICTYTPLFDCLIVALYSQKCSLFWIKWENHLEGSIIGQHCFISLDGTDFCIQELALFDPKWFSNKFEGPGVQYQVGIYL